MAGEHAEEGLTATLTKQPGPERIFQSPPPVGFTPRQRAAVNIADDRAERLQHFRRQRRNFDGKRPPLVNIPRNIALTRAFPSGRLPWAPPIAPGEQTTANPVGAKRDGGRNIRTGPTLAATAGRNILVNTSVNTSGPTAAPPQHSRQHPGRRMPPMEQSPAPGPAPVLGEGHYTVVRAGGGHRTLEVTKAGPDVGSEPLLVAYLCGPDNERDYRSFAHITADGAGRLWHRVRADSALAGALTALVVDPTDGAGTYRQRLRCAHCRRPLTHPDSIERGMGTRCARRLLAPVAPPADA
jgi:hypothetical protein